MGWGPSLKILLITHGFPPVRHSGTFRVEAFAKHLPEHGMEPVVFCASDESPVPKYANGDGPDAREQDGVLRLPWREQNLGLRASRARMLLGRLPLGATWARRRQRRSIAGALSGRLADFARGQGVRAIVASSPPSNAIVLGDHLSRVTGLPLLADLRDPWTYLPWAKYRHWIDFRLERSFERRVLNRCGAVLANNPTAKRLLTQVVGVAPEKVVVLPNGYDESDFEGPPEAGTASSDRFRIVYTGLLHTVLEQSTRFAAVKRALRLDYQPLCLDSKAKSPLHFLRAMEMLLDRRPEMKQSILLVFAGQFNAATLESLASFPYPECLQILGPMPHREAAAECRRADLCLLLQFGIWIGRDAWPLCVPGKLYDYLRSGTPILAAMQSSDATDLIRRFDAGRIADPHDTGAMAACVEEFYGRWRERKALRREPHAGLKLFDRRNLAAELAKSISCVVGGRPGGLTDTWPS